MHSLNVHNSKEINLPRSNNYKLIDISNIFEECWPLQKINFSNFNINHIINAEYTFNECSLLKELDLFDFNTNNNVLR